MLGYIEPLKELYKVGLHKHPPNPPSAGIGLEAFLGSLESASGIGRAEMQELPETNLHQGTSKFALLVNLWLKNPAGQFHFSFTTCCRTPGGSQVLGSLHVEYRFKMLHSSSLGLI